MDPVSHHELADSISAIVASFASAGEEASWEFSADSRAAADWSAHELAGPWGPQPLQDAYRTGLLLWWLVADHALALADAIRSDRAPAYLSLARGLAEASARSWFLLEPDVKPKERVRRLMNDRLHAIFEETTMWAHEPALADALAQRDQSKADIEAGARQFNLRFQDDVRTEGRWASARLGAGRPRTTNLLHRMVGNRESAATFYRSSSALTHAAIHAIGGRVTFSKDLARVKLTSLDADRVFADCVPVMVAMLDAVSTTLGQTGWDRKDFEQRALEAHTLWTGVVAVE